MKVRCIKSDPLEWLKVGEIYECTARNGVFLVGHGFGVNKDNFEQMFEVIQENAK